jgi:hypothetical protein
MIERWDDLPLHQTPAELARPASIDPRTYERYWFAAASTDGGWMLGAVVDVHPVLGALDAVFSVSDGARATSVFARDVLRHGRDVLTAGPFRMEFVRPMRRLRFRVDGEGFDADFEFDATTPAIAEDRVTRTRGDRIVQDRSRYVQLGTVVGRCRSPLGEVALDETSWRAGRDHSWGIWDAPDPDGPARPPGHGPSFFWLIGSFDDVGLQAVSHAEPDGTRYGEYAAIVPTLAAGAELVGPGAAQRPCTLREVSLRAEAGTRRVAEATLTLTGAGGASRPEGTRIAATGLHSVLPRSLGYAHPEWTPGVVPDHRPDVRTESWTTSELDLEAVENARALQFLRIRRDDGALGYAFVDQSGVPDQSGTPTDPDDQHRE